MKIKSQKDFWAGLMYMAVGTAFAVGAKNYTIGTGARMGPGYFPMILGVLLTLALESLSRLPFAVLLPITFAASMSFNFHHYIVDGIIWRTRKSAAHG